MEQNAFCRQVLAKHWPDAQRFNDVRDVGAHNLEAVDVICGGFPCQDISYAGKGAGLAGARSGLWYEFARIVGEVGPRYVVVENVRALATRGLDAVLGTLAELGYDAEWDNVSARSVGAPHRRDRLFIVAYANSTRRQPEGAAVGNPATRSRELGAGGWTQCEPATRGADLADATGVRFTQQGTRNQWSGPAASREGETNRLVSIGFGGQWESEPDVGRVADGVPNRVDRLAALGNAVVPQVAEVVGRRLLAIHSQLTQEQ